MPNWNGLPRELRLRICYQAAAPAATTIQTAFRRLHAAKVIQAAVRGVGTRARYMYIRYGTPSLHTIANNYTRIDYSS